MYNSYTICTAYNVTQFYNPLSTKFMVKNLGASTYSSFRPIKPKNKGDKIIFFYVAPAGLYLNTA